MLKSQLSQPQNPLVVVNLNTRGLWKVKELKPRLLAWMGALGSGIRASARCSLAPNLFFVPPEEALWNPNAGDFGEGLESVAQEQGWPKGTWGFFKTSHQFTSTFGPMVASGAHFITHDGGAAHLAFARGGTPLVVIQKADHPWLPPGCCPLYYSPTDEMNQHPWVAHMPALLRYGRWAFVNNNH